jgi:glycerol-3-phosphate acyltransferase PlsX
MKRPLTIALDGMGGDIGPDVVVPAALTVLKSAQEPVELILVGQQDSLAAKLADHGALQHPHLTIRHASQTVGMNDHPSQA